MRVISSFNQKLSSETRCLLIYIHDIIVITLSFPLSMLIRTNFIISDQHVPILLFGTISALIFSILLFHITNLHRGMWRYTSPPDLLRVLKCVIMIVALVFFALFLFDRLQHIPRSVLIIFGLLSFCGLSSSRILYGCFAATSASSQKGKEKRASVRVLILGDVNSTAGLAQAIQTLYGDFVHIVGVIGQRDDIGRHYQGVTVLGDLSGLEQILASLDIGGLRPHKIVTADRALDYQPNSFGKIVSVAEKHGLQVVSSTRLYELDDAEHLNTASRRLFKDRLATTRYQHAKRAFDCLAAGLALIVLSPLILLIGMTILVTMGRPIFFSQFRAGRYMREFQLIKFRTMRHPIGSSGKVLSDAERISRFGQFLRLTRLDELPQFWNILVGDMSLVGPRPLHSRDLLVDDLVLKKRYAALPGLSGWAQINGGKLLSNEQKMALDLEYIDKSSFALDLKIMLLTFRIIIFGDSINNNTKIE